MDNIVYSGKKLTCKWAIRKNGTMRAEEFFYGLSDRDQAKLYGDFELLGNDGRISSQEHFRKLKGAIFEFKNFQIRMPCFYAGKCPSVIITHGFTKRARRTPKNEIERAEQIMREHLERCEDCDGSECL